MSIPQPQPSTPAPAAGAYQPSVSTLADLVRQEADAIRSAAQTLDQSALDAAHATAHCRGNVIVTGVGKAGWVGQKLVATLGSTGTPAHFLHPCEAIHGDLGRVRPGDLVWAISNSGRSDELLNITGPLSAVAERTIAITASADNPLGRWADITVCTGGHREIDPDGLAPTASTAVMMAIGDAIAIVASQIRGFRANDFAKYHPGGSLGRKLSTAADWMRPASLCRVSTPETSIRNAVTASGKSGRRTGAIVVCDARSRLVGIFTDSDLARLLASGEESVLDHAIGTRMTRECKWTTTGTRYDAFVSQMNDAKISELPVVDDSGAWCGLIDATDLGIGIQVDEAATAAPSREQNQPIESVAGRPRLSIVSPEQDHQGTHFDV